MEWLNSEHGSVKDRPALDAVVQDGSLYQRYSDDSGEECRIRTEYRSSVLQKIIFTAVCLCLAIVIAGLVMGYGDYPLSLSEVYQILWSHVTDGAPSPDDALAYMKDHIVWNLRLPRVLVALVAGFGLAIAGAVMQSTMKNPMADSYTTGVSSGAAFGATLAIVLGVTFISNDVSMVAAAFICSLAPVALIVVLSRFGSMSATSMILVGLAVMYIFSALTTALKLMADPEALASLYRWQVGSLNNMVWDDVPIMAVVTVIGAFLMMLFSSKINMLASGDDAAKALGVDAPKMRIICLVIVSLMTASIVSYVGTIGFVGLVSPHVARLFMGADNRYLIPASAFFGALLMLVSDFVGRVILAPSVLEAGVVTAFIGGPMFLYLILRQRREVWT